MISRTHINNSKSTYHSGMSNLAYSHLDFTSFSDVLSQEKVSLQYRKLKGNIKIDGKLDEQDWLEVPFGELIGTTVP